MKDKINKIIMEKLNIDETEIKENSNLINDLKADSLDTVEIVMALEEEFNIEILDEDANKIDTVGDIYKYIKRKIK